jgi:hypothetical protein
MKCLVFDSGPIISMSLNSMLPIPKRLQKVYDGNFFISNAIRSELIEIPSHTRRYALEALNIENLIRTGCLELFDTEVYSEETALITDLANHIYFRGDNNLEILNRGELDSLVLAKNLEADAIVVDERTTRLLLENPYRLQKYLEKKFNSRISIDKEKLSEFETHFSTIKIIRSVELALVAVDIGLFDDLIRIEDRLKVVESILWALKLSGCAISEMEIKKLLKLYKRGR